MAKFYSVAKLSERLKETPEGFLVCEGVPITRSGDLMYGPGETPVSPGKGETVISRTVEDIHDPITIASFEGKPVTINHPDNFVTPETWRALAVGIVQNVRPGEGGEAEYLLADLLITDSEAIDAVKSKRLREVSCGYEAEYVEESPGRGRQENIIGNHVALVPAGRCGSECAIFDHAPKEGSFMILKQKILGLFGKALDEAMPEEPPPVTDMNAMMDALMKRMDAFESGSKKPDEKVDDMPEAESVDTNAAAIPADVEAALMAMIEKVMAKMNGASEMDAEDKGENMDAETVSRAEILAPGLSKSADIKAKALTVAYGTEDGKAAIDTLLGGKAFDSVSDKDMLFVAASELLKTARRGQLHNVRVSIDSLPVLKSGPKTPEEINAINAARYGKH